MEVLMYCSIPKTQAVKQDATEKNREINENLVFGYQLRAGVYLFYTKSCFI